MSIRRVIFGNSRRAVRYNLNQAFKFNLDVQVRIRPVGHILPREAVRASQMLPADAAACLAYQTRRNSSYSLI
jgi:hypothetical protein